MLQATVDANSKLVECLRGQAQTPEAVGQPTKPK
jgi:hypothetical protein